MKKYTFFIISLLIFAPFVQAQKAKSVFWEIRNKNNTKVSYLFGTHHLYDTQELIKNKILDKKLAEVETVVGEVALDMTAMLKVALASMMADKSLKDIFTPAEYTAIDTCLQNNTGYNIALFNNFKPIAVYQLILTNKYLKAFDMKVENAMDNSMDSYFQQVGKKANKEIQGLETVDQQIKLLYEGYTIEQQKEMLLEIVYDKGSNSIDEMKKLNALYKNQDLEALGKLTEASMSTDEKKNLLTTRNHNWMPKLEEILSQKSAFIAVGAGHLVGEDGLLHLLKEKGFKLKPIKIKL